MRKRRIRFLYTVLIVVALISTCIAYSTAGVANVEYFVASKNGDNGYFVVSDFPVIVEHDENSIKITAFVDSSLKRSEVQIFESYLGRAELTIRHSILSSDDHHEKKINDVAVSIERCDLSIEPFAENYGVSLNITIEVNLNSTDKLSDVEVQSYADFIGGLFPGIKPECIVFNDNMQNQYRVETFSEGNTLTP